MRALSVLGDPSGSKRSTAWTRGRRISSWSLPLATKGLSAEPCPRRHPARDSAARGADHRDCKPDRSDVAAGPLRRRRLRPTGHPDVVARIPDCWSHPHGVGVNPWDAREPGHVCGSCVVDDRARPTRISRVHSQLPSRWFVTFPHQSILLFVTDPITEW